MIIRKIKKATIDKLNISRQAVESRVKKIKRKFGPFSDEIAYGIVAHQAGIDISSILTDTEAQTSIRNELDRIATIESDSPTQKTKTIVKTVTINIGPDLSLTDPILSDQVIKDAKEMTAVYAEIYVFENSVREVINRVLTNKIGPNWWDTSVNNKIQDKVQKRINNEIKNAWHGRRGTHPIYYSDIADLKTIIQRHWTYFEPILANQEWVNVRLDEISLSRNIIDHHNPLRKRERQRLQIYTKDWQEQIKVHKDKILSPGQNYGN